MSRVELAAPAVEFLKSLGADIRKTIVNKLHDLETDPDKRGKPLSADLAVYRSIHAAGRYRIVYRVNGDTVFIVAIGIRKDADRADLYASLKRSLDRPD
jgi:mRNA-degrading endonuclease RelE of RelBE toxin-antitoxin system